MVKKRRAFLSAHLIFKDDQIRQVFRADYVWNGSRRCAILTRSSISPFPSSGCRPQTEELPQEAGGGGRSTGEKRNMTSGVVFDHDRKARIGLPEAVFCEGKDFEAVRGLLERFGRGSGHPILFTRLRPEVFERIPEETKALYSYHALSGTAFGDALPAVERGSVAVVSAGTSDGRVTWEAARTLEYLGIRHKVFEDCGAAGLWRLTQRLEEISSFDVIIVVAGMDAALATILGGLTPRPLFGVPTSVGYGVAEGGKTALAAMLASCAPGIGILNIDNGYGAACAAARVIHLL